MATMMHCKHNTRESKRGAGECKISADVKLRNGKPKFWCATHGQAASRPDGSKMDACPAAWEEPVPPHLRLEIDLAKGETAIWGVVEPALRWGDPPPSVGKIHVHRRPTADAHKEIDGSYDLVDLVHGRVRHQIEGMAAKARSISELSGVPVVPLKCPHCGDTHIDELMFATRLHRNHQCNGCGRNFVDSTGPSVSNPLADLYAELGLPRPPAPVRSSRTLDLVLDRYTAVELWPSNAAIVSTMTRPEEIGIHVHAWEGDTNREPTIDETYGTVSVSGVVIDEDALRILAVQRALADGKPIVSMACDHCTAPLTSPTAGWMEPTTTHTCAACGGTTRTKRKVFINPLAEKFF
ncbi:MAG TPA: hypothetical protein VNA20_16225 [Frankiaceae bacterium]|nr:hypothetical protein [Frankiaceae bacterium]